MSDHRTILAIEGCFVSKAAASVAGTLLGRPVRILTREEVAPEAQTLSEAFLILCCFPECNQVSALVRLRANGFAGPSLVASKQQLNELAERYSILKFADGTTDVWMSPFAIVDLLTHSRELVPLDSVFMEEIAWGVSAAESLPDRMKAAIDRICQSAHSGIPVESYFDLLRTSIAEMRAGAPSASHREVVLRGQSEQIQIHLSRALDALRAAARSSPFDDSVAAYFRDAIAKWREVASNDTDERFVLTR